MNEVLRRWLKRQHLAMIERKRIYFILIGHHSQSSDLITTFCSDFVVIFAAAFI